MILRLKHNIKYITLVVGMLIASTIIVLVIFSVAGSQKILAATLTDPANNYLNVNNVSGDLPEAIKESICNYDNPSISNSNTIDSNLNLCRGTLGFPSLCYNQATSYSPDLETWLSQYDSPNQTSINDPSDSSVTLQFNQLDFVCDADSSPTPTSPLTHYVPKSLGNIGVPKATSLFMKQVSIIASVRTTGGAVVGISQNQTSTISVNPNSRFMFNSPFTLILTPPSTPPSTPVYTVTFGYYAVEEFSSGNGSSQPIWECVANGGKIYWLNSTGNYTLARTKCEKSFRSINITIMLPKKPPTITTLTGVVTNQGTSMSGVTVQACDCAGDCGASDPNAYNSATETSSGYTSNYGGLSTTNSNGQYSLDVVKGSNTCISIQSGGPPNATPTLNTASAYSNYIDKSQYVITNWNPSPPTTGWDFNYTNKLGNCDTTNTVCLSVTYSCSSVTVTGTFEAGSYATAILSSPNPRNTQYYQYYDSYAPIHNDKSYTFYPKRSSIFPNGQYTVDLTWTNISPSVSFTLNCYTPPTLTSSSTCNSISGNVSQSPGDTEDVTVTLGLPDGSTESATVPQNGSYAFNFSGSDYGSQVYGSSGSFMLYATNNEGSSTPVSFNIGPCGNVCMYGSSGCSSVASSVPTAAQACSVSITPSGPIESGTPSTINYNIAYYEYGTNNNGNTPTISGTLAVAITNSSNPPTSSTYSYSIQEPSISGTSSVSSANATEDPVSGLSPGDYTISLTFNGTFDNGTYNGTLPQQQCSSTFVVANDPYFRVYGGDITAGQGFSSGIDSCNQESASVIGWNEGSKGNYAGAGGQFAVIAPGSQNDPGIINYLVTGDSPYYQATGGYPSSLAFGNADTSLSSGDYGGDYSGSTINCMPNYYAAPVAKTTDLINCSGNATIDSAGNVDGDCTNTGNQGYNLSNISGPTVLKVAGNLTINSNIAYNESSQWVNYGTITTTQTLSQPAQLVATSSPYMYTWTAPANTISVTFTVTGGAGGDTGYNLTGGQGQEITGTLSGSNLSGQTFDIYQGPAGGSTYNGTGGVSPVAYTGTNGAMNGGQGGVSSYGGGAGGGAASAVYDVSSDQWLIVAGGGGGEGGPGVYDCSGSVTGINPGAGGNATISGNAGSQYSSGFGGGGAGGAGGGTSGSNGGQWGGQDGGGDGGTGINNTSCNAQGGGGGGGGGGNYISNLLTNVQQSVAPTPSALTPPSSGSVSINYTTQTSNSTMVPNYDSLNVPGLYVVVSGNIYIAPSVTSLYGAYIAQPNNLSSPTTSSGIIYTCNDGLPPPNTNTNPTQSSYYQDCNNQLAVYGALAANQVVFGRTLGTALQGASGDSVVSPSQGFNNAAEVIYYNPSLWIQNPFALTTTGYDAITSLPPVL